MWHKVLFQKDLKHTLWTTLQRYEISGGVLSLTKVFFNGEKKPLNKNSTPDKVVLVFPGGPGISCKYLEKLIKVLSVNLGPEVGVHLFNYGNLDACEMRSYPVILQAIARETKSIAQLSSELILVGHSFGARVAYDLVGRNEDFNGAALRGAFLTSFSPDFSSSLAFEEKKINLSLPSVTDEASFQSYWRLILKIYTVKPMGESLVSILSNDTFWERSHLATSMSSDAIPIEIPLQKGFLKIVNGRFDVRLSDKTESFIEGNGIERECMNVGHFPMLELPIIFESILTEFCSTRFSL